jgi:hypothetical protein
MKTIRFGTFETNSSSEHSVSLYNADEIKDFREGREYYDSYGGFCSIATWKEDLKEKKYNITDEQLKQMFDWLISLIKEEEDIRGYYFDSDEYDEKFDKSFTEDMIAFLKETLSNSGLLWVWDNWGYGYEESDIDQITTPHGDVVYALSYSVYCD